MLTTIAMLLGSFALVALCGWAIWKAIVSLEPAGWPHPSQPAVLVVSVLLATVGACVVEARKA